MADNLNSMIRPAISRRSVAAGALASLAAFSTGPAQAAMDPDAELIALCDVYRKRYAEWYELDSHAADLEDAVADAWGADPDILKPRQHPKLSPNFRRPENGTAYSKRDLVWLRAATKNPDLKEAVDEIISAVVERYRRVDDVRAALRVEEAVQHAGQMYGEITVISNQIIATPAKTLRGLQAKASIIHQYYGRSANTNKDTLKDDVVVEPIGSLLEAMIADLQAMA